MSSTETDAGDGYMCHDCGGVMSRDHDVSDVAVHVSVWRCQRCDAVGTRLRGEDAVVYGGALSLSD
jgi:hypothetical protein